MIKEIESFLGFTKSYKYFIKNFSHIAKPLNELKGKNEWKWEEEYPISTHSSIQRVERKDYKSTSTCSVQKERKI